MSSLHWRGWGWTAIPGLVAAIAGCGGDPTATPVVATVVVTATTDTLTSLGQTTQLTAVAQDASGNTISGKTFTWNSSAPNVVSVDQAGLVTAVSNGPATITATVDATSGQAVLTVAQPAADLAFTTPVSLVESLGRVAIGNQVHIVGHSNGQLVHRTSQDDGATWSVPKVIAPASDNYPAMYGGLFSLGDTVYLLTAAGGDMASGPRQMDFRKSSDNGATWSAPVRITGTGQPVFRARIVASGNYVHVAGVGTPTPSGNVLYFRSVDGGTTWESAVLLAQNLGPYGGGQTVAVDGDVVHVPYTTAVDGVGGGPSLYIRSTDNGTSWSAPIVIGESSAESSRQARIQITAADGYVFASWQRESEFTGAPLLADRLGYNRSADGGLTWGTAQVLPEDQGINRNHQQVWMVSGGGVHIAWRHGDTDSDAAGYMYSPDYGATWEQGVIAIDTPGANHPFSFVADARAVHLLTSSAGTFQYAYRLLQ